MFKRKYRSYSYLFFFFSLVFTGFLINALLKQTGISRIVFVLLFGFLIFQLLQAAFLMRQKARELDLK